MRGREENLVALARFTKSTNRLTFDSRGADVFRV